MRHLAPLPFLFLLGCSAEPADSGDPDPPVGIGLGATCVAAEECGGATPQCTSGFCVECQADQGCAPDEVCLANGLCGECAVDGDCATGEPFCRGDGRCSECRSAEDCGVATPSCDPRGECVAACSDAAPCAEGVCHPVLAACVECVNAGDCTESDKPLCSALARCEECLVNDDCGAAAPHCVRGECRQCIQNTDCGAGGSCNDELECVAACVDDSQCGGDAPACDVIAAVCRECIDDARCAAADPEKPVCVGWRCEECRVDQDCPVDQPICDRGECKD